MYKKGFTIIEMLIVVLIIGILMSILIVSFSTFRTVQTLEKDTELVVEVLRQARNQTLSSQNSTTYGVYFASSTVTLFSGATYSAGHSENQVYSLGVTDTVVNVALTGSTTQIVFKRLSGETAQNGTITISSPTTNRSRTITVYKTGLIQY